MFDFRSTDLLYDSHVHFRAVGDFADRLNLSEVQTHFDLERLSLTAEPTRGSWVLGYGWDNKKWDNTLSLNIKTLNHLFKNNPVLFSKNDGHSVWANQRAFEELNFEVNKEGLLTESQVFEAHNRLPELSVKELGSQLLKAHQIFIAQKFGAVRDMGCDLKQWKVLQKLSVTPEWTLDYTAYFRYELSSDFNSYLEQLLAIKNAPQSLSSAFVKFGGAKIFFDGSLGSKTAYLSQNYSSTNQRGKLLIEPDRLKYLIKSLWQKEISVAVHVIGDEASHQLALIVEELYADGVKGHLDIEHGQMMRAETISLLENKDITVHMQPCHFLEDKSWMFKAVPKALHTSFFPWAQLNQKNIDIKFGSDAPLVNPSIENNFEAIRIAADYGIEPINVDSLMQFHIKNQI